MLILLDCRALFLAGPDTEKSRLVFSVVTALVRDSQWQWLLVAGPTDTVPDLPGTRLIRQRVLGGRLGWRIWYDVLLPRLVKKQKAALLITTGGIAAKTPIPQCLWMPERVNPREGRSYPPLYPGRLTESLRRAAALFCYSDRDRDWLVARETGTGNKTVVLHPSPARAAAPLSIDGREAAKAEFAQGREYFLADGTAAGEEGWVYLLKAFSLFKRRQHSNLQLIVKGIPNDGWQKRLETYKYREDVHWRPSTAADSRLMAGAYAGLFLFEDETLGEPLLEAWRSGVPVIGKSGGILQELGGDAMLGAEGTDPAGLAAHLMSVYKDEQLRSRLIGLGEARLAAFQPEHAIDAVRSNIRRSVESAKIS
jgi:glycosyltransferase involved in cell wall biosynthesis